MESNEKKTPFKNKRERNEGYVTAAMQIFKDKQILNGRPEGMDKETYQFLRKQQTLILKDLFRKAPLRKLQGAMGGTEPLARTKKGMSRVAKRMITQRKAS